MQLTLMPMEFEFDPLRLSVSRIPPPMLVIAPNAPLVDAIIALPRQNEQQVQSPASFTEYLTAAKKEYLANDTAEGFVQRMRAAFPSFDGDVLLHHQLRFLFPKS